MEVLLEIAFLSVLRKADTANVGRFGATIDEVTLTANAKGNMALLVVFRGVFKLFLQIFARLLKAI